MPLKKSRRSLGKDSPVNSREQFEKLLKNLSQGEHYLLRLFVSGNSPRSTQAITTIRSLCEEFLKGRYELEVIDIYQQPSVASENQIIAAPTLIKSEPPPVRRIIGNLSDRQKILLELNLTNVAGKKGA